tara:strand:- start:115 stop:588 length:474 start_codon:yes stop_codon:yes gene_type:complete
MGKFHNLLDAKFNPPRNWTLDTPLKFDSDTLSDEGRNLLKYCGVRVTNKNVVSVPKGYITDLASVPRFCWAFIAPFDVARAAVIHDILYEKINTAYKGEKILTKHDREKYRKVADDVFKEGMESAVPPVPKWKIWAAYNAVRVFGRWAINSSAPRRA